MLYEDDMMLLPGHTPTFTGLGYAELTPADSASVVHSDRHSTVSSSHLQGNNNGNTFSFKFNYGNKTHRFRHDIHDFKGLLDVIQQKIMVEHLNISQSYVAVGDESDWLTVAYLDDEEDQVLMTSDTDLHDAVELAKKSGLDRVRLFVHDSLADALAEQQQTEQKKEVVETKKEEDLSEIVEEEEEVVVPKKKKQRRDVAAEYNLPIPQDLLLPAAITFLGVVILGVFTISKLTSNNSNSRY